MPTEQILSGDYFDTPARAERLQLLLHLVRNAGEVIYLRGPAGAGKTRFVHRLFDILGDEVASVWVPADSDSDVPAVVADQLGLVPGDIGPWPDAVLNAITDRDLLVIVDDADRLGLEAVDSLAQLHARGGRLLLVGKGGLAQTSGNWDVQFVDLPPFDAEQTVAFLRSQAGDQAARVTDDLAAGLHRAANGVPGLLLDALNGVLANRRSAPVAPRSDDRAADPGTRKRPVWHWLAAGLVLVALVIVLQFQDRINAVFMTEDGVDRGAPDTVVAEPVAPVVPVAPAPVRVTPDEPAPEAAAPEDLREEALPAQMPEITLPELSREPTASDKSMAEPSPSPAQPAAAVPVEKTVADTGADEDPLEAVMRDAIAAAEKKQVPDPVPAEPIAKPDQAPVDETPANGMSVAIIERPAGDVAEVPVQKQAPPAVAAQQPEPKPQPEPEPEPDATPTQITRAPPVPVESRRVAPAPAPVVEAKPAMVLSTRAPVGGSDWLKSRPPSRYTLQLVGSRDRAAVQKFVRDYRIDRPYAIFERDLKGKPWYSLVAGDYPDREAAIAARGRLPKNLERSGVWPRTFESIHKVK